MSKTSGLVLIVAGLSAAAYVTPWSPGPDPEKHLIDVVKIATNGQEKSVARDPLPAPVIAPQPRPAIRTGPSDAKPAADAPPLAKPTPAEAKRAAMLAPASSAAPLADPSRDDGANLALRSSGSKPVDREARHTLASDIQKELKRVGCFDGEASGEWTPATRKAMRSFTERVNATLPVDEPDYILLTLIQGHATSACGKSCPTGQSLAGDGRCVPAAVLAQAQRRTVPKSAATPAAAPAAGDSKPAADAAKAGPTPSAIAAWETTTAATPRGELPGGRMSIGAAQAQTEQQLKSNGSLAAAPDSPADGKAAAAAAKKVAAKPRMEKSSSSVSGEPPPASPKTRVAAVSPKADTEDEPADEGSAAKAKAATPAKPAYVVEPGLRRPAPRIVYYAPPRYYSPPPVRIFGALSSSRSSSFNTQSLFARLAREGR